MIIGLYLRLPRNPPGTGLCAATGYSWNSLGSQLAKGISTGLHSSLQRKQKHSKQHKCTWLWGCHAPRWGFVPASLKSWFSPPAQSNQSFTLLKADKGIDKSIECSSSVLPTCCSPVLEVQHRQLSLWIMASFSLTCLVLLFLYLHVWWKNRGSNYSLMKHSWIYTDCFSCQDSICSLFCLDLHLTPLFLITEISLDPLVTDISFFLFPKSHWLQLELWVTIGWNSFFAYSLQKRNFTEM